MAQTLGTVTKIDDRYEGILNMISIRTRIRILPNKNKSSDGAPDYRIYADHNVEIGGGWNKISKTSGKTYLSLTLAAPEFGPSIIHANLGHAAGEGEAVMAILWNPKG